MGIRDIIKKFLYKLKGGEYGQKQEKRIKETPEGRNILERIKKAKWYQFK